MNTWLYHDITRAEHILKRGFDRNNLAVDMKMLCMYYRDVLGYKPKQRRKALEEFCREHIAGYNEVLYFRIIDSALDFAQKKNSRLVEIKKIDIYKSEVDYINNLPVEPNFKRVLFALLVAVKLHKTMIATIYTAYKDGYFTSKRVKDSDIFNSAHVTTSLTKKCLTSNRISWRLQCKDHFGVCIRKRDHIMRDKISKHFICSFLDV